MIKDLRGIVEAVEASNDPAFGWTPVRLDEAVESLARATEWMLDRRDNEADAALAGATPYLRLFGLATGGCLLAQRGARGAADRRRRGARARRWRASLPRISPCRPARSNAPSSKAQPGLLGGDAALA